MDTNEYSETKHNTTLGRDIIGEGMMSPIKTRKRDASRAREKRRRVRVCAMNVDVKVAFRAAVAEAAPNEVARVAEELGGRVGGIGDQGEGVVGVGRVREGPACAEAVFVQEVVALPAGEDVARARGSAAGAVDLGPWRRLVEDQAVDVAEMLQFHSFTWLMCV